MYMNKVISFFLVLSILFIGLGFVSLDSSSHMKFSHLVEPFFNSISNVSEKALSFISFFTSSDSNVTTTRIVPISSRYDPSTYSEYLYSCRILTHAHWHSCYLLRINVDGDFSVFVVVYDDYSSHSLEGWVCCGWLDDHQSFFTTLLNGNGVWSWSFPERAVRDWTVTGYTYYSLQDEFPDHPLYSNVDSDEPDDPPGGFDPISDTPGLDGPGQVT